jgi:hypothetical protein
VPGIEAVGGADRRTRRTTWLVLAAALLYVVPLWWGLERGRYWVYDEPSSRAVLPQALDSKATWPLRYPPLHRWVLAAVYAPALPAARWASGAFELPLPVVLQVVGRAVSVAFALATLGLVLALGRRLAGERAGWLAALFWLGVAPQAYYAKTMNLEAPYLAWFALSLLFFLDFRRHGRGHDLAGYALASAAAILTKDQAYGLYLLPTLVLVYGLVAERRAAGSPWARALTGALRDTRLWVAAAAFALAFAIVYRVWNGFGESLVHAREISGWRAMERFREVDGTLAGHLELARASWINLAFCLGSAGMVLAALALAVEGSRVFDRRRADDGRRAAELLLFPLSYYLGFVSVVRYSYDRFFLPVALVLAPLVGCALSTLLAKPTARRGRTAAALAVGAALGFGIARSLAVDALMLFDQRVRVERILEGGGRSVGLSGLVRQLPRVDDRAPVYRFKHHACERLVGVDHVVLQPGQLDTGLGAQLRDGFARGDFGFRRVDVPRFEVPRWLVDFESAATNLAWINMETWLFRRDPALPCRDRPD